MTDLKEEEVDHRALELRALQKRLVSLSGDLSSKIGKGIKEEIYTCNIASEIEPIKLLIDCHGGHAETALEIFDLIKCSKAPVHGIVMGDCRSAAVVVLMACHKRVALRHSRLFIHRAMNQTAITLGRGYEDHLRSALENGNKLAESIDRLVIARTRLDPAKYADLVERGEKYGEVIRADIALEYGLLDEVVDTYEIF